MKTIYIGNLAYETTEEDLRGEFAAFGEVAEVRLVRDRVSGRSKGFAFVEMRNDDQATAAVEGLNRKEIHGRTMDVSEARPRTEGGGGRRPQRGGGGRRPRW